MFVIKTEKNRDPGEFIPVYRYDRLSDLLEKGGGCPWRDRTAICWLIQPSCNSA